jgi:hypothetical protein
MIIIDTPFHITFSSFNDHPEYACTAKCKKSWWKIDFENKPTMGLCPMCKGGLTAAVEKVHYKIIEKENRNLNELDIRKYNAVDGEEKLKELSKLLKQGAVVTHLSHVKDTFVPKAIEEWSGHKNGVNLTFVDVENN